MKVPNPLRNNPRLLVDSLKFQNLSDMILLIKSVTEPLSGLEHEERKSL